MYCLDFFPLTQNLATMLCIWYNMHKFLHKPNLFHATNYVVQVIAEQKMICYFYTLPQHSKNLLICCPIKPCSMLHHKPVTKPALMSYTIQNMSTKPVKNCSIQYALTCIITATKLHQNGKRKLYGKSIKAVGKNSSK